MDWTRGEYTISDDPARLDHAAIHRFLAAAYWASDRPAAVIEHSLEHSVTFGVYRADAMVGMARVVTDFATVAWLCDVWLDEAHRGGNGTWLIDTVLQHPDLKRVRRWLLATSYSQALYRRAGFEVVEDGLYMARTVPYGDSAGG